MSVRRNSSRTNINSAYNTAAVQTSNSKTIAPDTAVVREFSGGAFAPTITAVAITDSDYNIIDDTNVSTGGGYIRITGTGFVSGCVVYIGGVAALSTTLLNSTQVNVQISATSSNTLHVYLVNPDGGAAIYLSGITFSGVPTWSTDPTLSGVVNEVAFSIGLSATSNSTVAYSLTAGSTLPPGTTLTSAGVFSGTVTGLSADTTYSFSVTATDLELQDTPRTFSVTVAIGDPYLYLTPVLLNGESNVWTRDSSVNKLLPIIGGDTRPTAFTPYNAYWSALFAAGNYLTVSGNSNLAFGTGDFIIEFFIYFTSVASAQNIYDARPALTNGAYPVIYLDNTTGKIIYYVNTAARITSDAVVLANQWYHVVVSRVSSVTRMFINGTQQTTTYSDTNTYLNGASRPIIGASSDLVSPVVGYISNLRALNGTGTTSPTVPTAPLTAIADTQLLTLQDNRFKDNSTNAYAITVTGATATKSFTPFVETDLITGSAYFDGTTDFLTIADNAALELGAGDFCVELWIHPTTVSGTGTIIDKRSGTYGPLLFWRFGATLQLYMSSNNSSWNLANGVTVGTVTANQWYHIAIYRVGSTIYSAFNGTVSTVTASGSATPHNNAGAWYFGTGTNGSSDPYTGYMADMRFVIGSGVYTGSNFTPPATSLTAITNTQLLTLQYRTGENNHRFIDEAGLKNVITRAGNASQGSFSPYSPAGWSAYFGGTTDYLQVASTTFFNFGTGNFSFEVWGFALSWPSIWRIITTASGFNINADTTSGAVKVDATSVNTTLSLNTWFHLVVTRQSGTLRVFLDGVLKYTAASSTNYSTTGVAYIGGIAGFTQSWHGYLSNMRVVTGSVPTSYQTSSTTIGATIFTTPISALSLSSQGQSDATVFLTNHVNRFIDGNTTPLTITIGNTPKVQAFSPFRNSGTYTPATHGGSAYFDGTGDYLTMPVNAATDLTQGDFTVEAWIYRNVAGAIHNIYSNRGAASTDGLEFRVNADNTLQVFYTGSGNTITSTLTILAGQWCHVAAVRIGSAVYLYINGLQAGTTSISNGTVGTGTTKIGADNGSANTFNGYISGLRVVKNQGIFTGNFTVPTTAAGTSQTSSTNVAAMSGNVTLLTNFTNAGIVDATGRNTFETTGANVTISNVASKFGIGSISFPGALTAYLKTPTNPSLDFGTGDFTVEFWVYFNSVAADQGIFGGSTTNAWEIRWRTSTGLNLGRLNTAFDSTFAWSPSAATWYHVAVTRSGTSVRGFVNGTQIGTTSTNSNTYNSGTLFYVGITDTSNNAFNGYLDDVRITKGYARYTANFTAPTSPFLTK
jgi:hypothetical protein